MEFDKTKVFTALNAEEVRAGSRGYFADTIKSLKDMVNLEDKDCYDSVKSIRDTAYVHRFIRKSGCIAEFALFYLVEEPVKERALRPYRDTDEMIEHYNNHFGLLPTRHRPPAMWIKRKNNDRAYLITRITGDSVTVCFERSAFTLSLELLLSEYTWFDGAFCGVEENDN